MSLLHLLGVDDDISFDGKGIDKAIDNIKGYANNKFIKYVDFDFIPETAVLNPSDKSGSVCYISGDWEFDLSTYVGYNGLRLTPKTIRFKHLDFCKAYDKVVEIGLDPKNLTIEDVQLLKIVDNQNKLVYNLFIK